jgi:DNA-binding GntR family transcriptional regulator
VTKKEVDLPSTYRFLFDNNIPLPDTVLLDIKPRVGDTLAMEMLEIGKNDPYMEVMERGFDIHQNLVLRSKTIFRDQVFNFTIVRKRINWAKVFS